MRKLFLLIPALVLSLAINAAITPVPSGVNTLKTAVAAATTGDILELGDGIFYEEGNFDMKVNLTIKAAEGAYPVIANRYFFRIEGGADITFQGIKFDGAAWRSGDADPVGASDHCVRSHDNSNGEEVITFNNCEFTGYPSHILYFQRGNRKIGTLNINNCYFHDNVRSAVYVGYESSYAGLACVNISITNSTFANFTNVAEALIAIKNDGTESANQHVVIDHCTFYNYVKNSTGSYTFVDVRKATDVAISNSIFAQPTADMSGATYVYGGSIDNCLIYNTTGHRSSSIVHNGITADPLFKDAANGDFTLYNASPARGKATDNSDLGDPRWATAITPVAIPATLQPLDAMLSDSAGVVHGTPNQINFKARGSHKYNNTEWAKWPITVTKAGMYKFTANVTSTNSQKYTLSILDNNESPVTNGVVEQVSDIGSGAKTFSTEVVNLTAGEYYVKIVDTVSWSNGQIINIQAIYEGGATIAIPDTLWPADAIRSTRAWVDKTGDVDSLLFTPRGSEGHASNSDYTEAEYGKWKININKGGKYKFTANTRSLNGHNYRITILNSDESTIINTKQEAASGTYAWDAQGSNWQVATDVLDLAAGSYVVKIENYKASEGRVMNIIASYEGGAVVNIPGEILAADALLKAKAEGTLKMIHNGDGDIEYKSHVNPLEEYALWNIHATEAGEMEVSFNSPSNGHQFRFELYQNETMIGVVEESAASWDHEVTLTDHLTFSAAGDYTLKLINKQQYSGGVLHGITFTSYVAPEPPAVVTMTDTDTDNAAWIAEKNNTVDVQLNRTILGGMYNTICLPFKVSTTQCKAVFGDDVELWTLGSAELSGDILNLNFNPANDIWKGTPIMIKTSHDVVNPTFTGVTIESETGDVTPKNAANFRGSFVQQVFHAGDPVLLLMANNTLVFPQSDKTLKGFRAYFQINGNPANAPKRARIILQEQVATDIDLIQPQMVNAAKVIENGQLVIIKNGVRYNVMGAMIKY